MITPHSLSPPTQLKPNSAHGTCGLHPNHHDPPCFDVSALSTQIDTPQRPFSTPLQAPHRIRRQYPHRRLALLGSTSPLAAHVTARRNLSIEDDRISVLANNNVNVRYEVTGRQPIWRVHGVRGVDSLGPTGGGRGVMVIFGIYEDGWVVLTWLSLGPRRVRVMAGSWMIDQQYTG
ncbi:hypothetical protein BDZ85DRAFT_255502 [Elsinoe ampelina]|uniref:Uncharacterized protein n=1 Tax=Elsinoe ampelina TaxID=302913 RepID=A0A6A6GQX4_9PEZI|nr:hypothetical protein BDZ85DRAFT_255502 [Elsinoe ampelina]